MRSLWIVAPVTLLAVGSSFQGLTATPLVHPQAGTSGGAHWLAQAQAPKRSALVIGNGAYAEASLDNAVNDAEDVARTLQEIGFQVTLLRNADKRTIDEAVDSFRRQLSQGDYGLFYFSGHGVQVAGENYLIPLKAILNIEADVEYNAVPLRKILNAVEASKATARIIVIDACRDNPFYRRWRSTTRGVTTRGLATPMVAGRGTLIAFSTAPDQKAEDGIGGRNSPFTTYLLRHLKTSMLDVRLMLGRVRQDVLQATRNKQIPWTNESLTGEVYLNPQASQTPASAAPSSDSVALEPGPSLRSQPSQPELTALLPQRPAQLAVSSLSAAGSSFPSLFYQSAFASLAATGLKVNYQAVGSGSAVRQFVAETVDLGASDEPIKSSEAAKVSRGVVQFPSVGGTIAIGYNKPDCMNLKLTQKQLVDIYLGTITTWDALKCGKGPIRVVHRSDGSGTTFAFTNSLSAFSPQFKSKVGKGKSVSWPVGVGGRGNEGVAGIVANTPGALGYMSQAFVKGAIKPAALQNRAGKFVLPGLKGGMAALEGIKLDGNLAGDDPNPAGVDSYPTSTLSWILAYEKGNGAKAGAIRQMMQYLLSTAVQNRAADLGYVPLPDSILSASKKVVARIRE